MSDKSTCQRNRPPEYLFIRVGCDRAESIKPTAVHCTAIKRDLRQDQLPAGMGRCKHGDTAGMGALQSSGHCSHRNPANQFTNTEFM